MVFVNSNVFISIWDGDNVNHKLAIQKSKNLQKLGESIVISNIVAYEVLSILAMRVSKLKSLAFLNFLDKEEIGLYL